MRLAAMVLIAAEQVFTCQGPRSTHLRQNWPDTHSACNNHSRYSGRATPESGQTLVDQSRLIVPAQMQLHGGVESSLSGGTQ